MKYGFVKVASAIPSVKVADTDFNVQQIETLVTQAEKENVELLVFPELSITGYSCQDLFTQQLLIAEAEKAVAHLLDFTKKMDIVCIVGAPVVVNGLMFNCAVIIHHGKIISIIPKAYLPNYGEFYEKRWFASSQDLNEAQIIYANNNVTVSPLPEIIRMANGVQFAVEICEDVWAPVPRSNHLALAGADIIFNLSASDDIIGKHDYLKSLLAQQSARLISGYVYSGCGFGESTQDVVYGGNALIYENGILLAEAERFSLQPQLMITQIDVEKLRSERQRNTTFVNAQRQETAIVKCTEPTKTKEFSLVRSVNPHPFIPEAENVSSVCKEIFNIQVAGLAKRLVHINAKRVIVGISGGLDSTLALIVCVKTFDRLGYDRSGILGVTMPGFGTTDRTYNNALSLMKSLGVEIREINIAQSVTTHFKDIDHDATVHDVTYENSQARERTQILMDLSNQVGGIVIGTGDLSELALGWATYNGDHMSMYGVNASIPKTLIQYLVRYAAETMHDEKTKMTLLDIVDTPISPELTPADDNGEIKQKTEDLVGPYELHDFFLYNFLRFGFSPRKIFMLACKAFNGDTHNTNVYDAATIKKWLLVFSRRFFNQQFKRSCLPDGPKVGSVSLSPRGDWRMPSDASSALWIKECEAL